MLTRKRVRLLVAHRSLVLHNPPPHLRPHPPPTPSSGTDEVISITAQTVRITVKLRRIIEWSLIVPLKRKRQGIGGQGIVREAHPVPPGETQGVCEARRGCVYQRRGPQTGPRPADKAPLIPLARHCQVTIKWLPRPGVSCRIVPYRETSTYKGKCNERTQGATVHNTPRSCQGLVVWRVFTNWRSRVLSPLGRLRNSRPHCCWMAQRTAAISTISGVISSC